MNTSYVKIALSDGAVIDGKISMSSSPPWVVQLVAPNLPDDIFSGADLFEALISLRKRLDQLGCLLLCAGARRDVWPSGMGRSMGGAKKAYILEIDKPAEVLVDIFSEADLQQVSTVEDQKKFWGMWVESLRAKLK